jgi:predicted O-methyltransferase YrrM
MNQADFFLRFYPRLGDLLSGFSKAYGANKDGHPPRTDIAGMAKAIENARDIFFEMHGSGAGGENTSDAHGLITTLFEIAKFAETHDGLIPGGGVELGRMLKGSTESIRNAAGTKGLRSLDIGHFKNLGEFRIKSFEALNMVYGRVFGQVKFSTPDPRGQKDFFDSASVERDAPLSSRNLIKASVEKLPGWCSNAKSWLVYDLVRKSRPKVAVEVGIFGGRSLSIIAQALRENGEGVVYGIETWSGAGAIRYRTDLANDFWWQNIDFIGVKRQFYQFFLDHHLIDVTRVIELSSETAHLGLQEIDFLHIDGNHSMFGAAQDVVNYFGKLKPGGYVVFDDINWPSTRAGLEILMDTAELVATVPKSDDSEIPGCAAFRKV